MAGGGWVQRARLNGTQRDLIYNGTVVADIALDMKVLIFVFAGTRFARISGACDSVALNSNRCAGRLGVLGGGARGAGAARALRGRRRRAGRAVPFEPPPRGARRLQRLAVLARHVGL